MSLLTFFTKLLRYVPEEIAHNIALKGLNLLHAMGMLNLLIEENQNSLSRIEVPNLGNMKNKLGIAAGLDKNGEYIDSLAMLGIGFLEVGTVTPKPQLGNPKPRLFRNFEDKSLVNRLGFNNKGVDYLVTK